MGLQKKSIKNMPVLVPPQRLVLAKKVGSMSILSPYANAKLRMNKTKLWQCAPYSAGLCHGLETIEQQGFTCRSGYLV
jgi:hypothetical protein